MHLRPGKYNLSFMLMSDCYRGLDIETSFTIEIKKERFVAVVFLFLCLILVTFWMILS